MEYPTKEMAEKVGSVLAQVPSYGEGEFWFSSFKILLILGLIVMTFILMVGGNPSGDAFRFRYWNNPGAFNEYLAPDATGRFLGFWGCFVQAAYAFGGPDYIALAAGETRSPRRVLPSVFSRVTYRLVFSYILDILAAGILVPHNDPDLVNSKPGAGSSPFVIGVKRLGIPVLPSVINAVLLTSAWSCGIEVFFAAIRSLYALVIDRKAPKFLVKTWRGTPIYCVLAIWLVAQISYMAASSSSLTVFNWLANIIGSSMLLAFMMFHVIYIRFRNAQIAQGIIDAQRLWFPSSFTPSYSSLMAFRSLEGHWSIEDFIFAYFSVAIFLALYLGYKLIYRPKMPSPSQLSLMAGRTETDIDDTFVEKEPTTKKEKFHRWLWG
ncbi:hypothetical protein K431DRAFT_330104 [Polychaeton citri CBS 116435]|uniref:Amino acid permease/ SLC12A domain-containing protein n=1 Tax=Polychaeton citri CBS 116435 TaxID=1314669 RepID=A0A9P4Q8U2_9PEZI|nr:hypothetical protein K431DRAFT_330104 [Polychaeton citri CBS 116435]